MWRSPSAAGDEDGVHRAIHDHGRHGRGWHAAFCADFKRGREGRNAGDPVGQFDGDTIRELAAVRAAGGVDPVLVDASFNQYIKQNIDKGHVVRLAGNRSRSAVVPGLQVAFRRSSQQIGSVRCDEHHAFFLGNLQPFQVRTAAVAKRRVRVLRRAVEDDDGRQTGKLGRFVT